MKIKKLLSLTLATLLSASILGLMNGQTVKADTPASTTEVGVTYDSHVENIGWQPWVSNGAEAGTDGKGLRVEALKVNLTNAPAGAHVDVQAHVENIGWQNTVKDGQEAGTDGKALRVEAIKLTLENMPGYSIQYRTHVQNIGWQNWVSDGQKAGTDGKALRVEAIEIKLVKISDNSTVGVQYQGHVQNVGWQPAATNGQIAGTEGEALRVEALKIGLLNAQAGAKIDYQTHVENIGWQTPVSDNAEAGTDGKSLRVEAIKIALENLPGYSVQYRSQVENIGWQPWVSDGQEAGTDGKALRVEAIEVRIVKTADGSTPTPVPFINNITNVASVALNKPTDTLTVGSTDTLTATVSPSNATNKAVTWTTSDSKVVSVDTTGKITAVSAGAATITATTADGNKTGTCTVTVNNIVVVPVTSVVLNKTTDALIIGNSDLLVATVVPSNATNQAVAWSSSNPAVAEVDATGKVTAVSAGTSNITATTVDGAKTSTCAITVVNPSIVSIDDITTNLVQNDTYTLPQTVVANMDNGKTSTVNVSWQPSVADTSKIGTFTFQGLVDGYSKNVKLTLNIQEYVPNLSISSYSALTINGICKSLSLNLENDGSKPVTINKIEVYQNGILVTTYTSSDLTAAGISTTVESKQNWQSGIDYALGITLNNSYVMYYTESNGSPYQYKSVIN